MVLAAVPGSLAVRKADDQEERAPLVLATELAELLLIVHVLRIDVVESLLLNRAAVGQVAAQAAAASPVVIL
jgi:hypothetical protein